MLLLRCVFILLISSREVTSARKLPKSPEEIENLMVEKSRGVKVILPPGVAVTQSGQIIQCTTGSGQQPVLIFQQPQTQSIAQITAASSVDQSIPRQTIISSQAMGPSNSIKPVVCQQENIYGMHLCLLTDLFSLI
ncbi:unnamed protein product [Trichobilharzia regenti]|nr:unnamed protein product [Trichobilharzia regenti]